MHGLHTTAWVFDTNDYKALKVIDQYRDTEHALEGGLRIIKALAADFQQQGYEISILNDEVLLGDNFLKGICITCNILNIGAFVPNSEISDPMEIFIENDTIHRI